MPHLQALLLLITATAAQTRCNTAPVAKTFTEQAVTEGSATAMVGPATNHTMVPLEFGGLRS